MSEPEPNEGAETLIDQWLRLSAMLTDYAETRKRVVEVVGKLGAELATRLPLDAELPASFRVIHDNDGRWLTCAAGQVRIGVDSNGALACNDEQALAFAEHIRTGWAAATADAVDKLRGELEDALRVLNIAANWGDYPPSTGSAIGGDEVAHPADALHAHQEPADYDGLTLDERVQRRQEELAAGGGLSVGGVTGDAARALGESHGESAS